MEIKSNFENKHFTTDMVFYKQFKVPYNYDFPNLYSKVKEKINKHSYKKGNIIKYYLIVIKRYCLI